MSSQRAHAARVSGARPTSSSLTHPRLCAPSQSSRRWPAPASRTRARNPRSRACLPLRLPRPHHPGLCEQLYGADLASQMGPAPRRLHARVLRRAAGDQPPRHAVTMCSAFATARSSARRCCCDLPGAVVGAVVVVGGGVYVGAALLWTAQGRFGSNGGGRRLGPHLRRLLGIFNLSAHRADDLFCSRPTRGRPRLYIFLACIVAGAFACGLLSAPPTRAAAAAGALPPQPDAAQRPPRVVAADAAAGDAAAPPPAGRGWWGRGGR